MVQERGESSSHSFVKTITSYIPLQVSFMSFYKRTLNDYHLPLSPVSSYVMEREYLKIYSMPVMKIANDVTTRCKSALPCLRFGL